MNEHNNTDSFDLEIKNNQKKYNTGTLLLKVKDLQQKFVPVALSSSFDKNEFVRLLNPKISKQMVELLEESLQVGDFTSLDYCSERIHAGLLNNHPVFRRVLDIDQRDKYIYDLSMQILKSSMDGCLPNEVAIVALKNILVYCETEAKTIGLLDEQESILSIYRYLKYNNILSGTL
ncbi:hypothetical protein PIROE2DRAFT_4176 [Piromyces sp. E2]|nr:hypothetical protein PIROE2DRAFT_4176 [Piromyces sp. E2]|eukprot:OUM68175.1 hypothetical protein PIROE2DRAFT_4176 [Piromyces sp. E2]